MTTSSTHPLVLLLVAIILGSSSAAAALAQEATPTAEGVTVLPPGELVDGASIGEWSARHWQWTTSFPVKVNPGHDVTGARCGYGQSGLVFFIPRNFAPCTVPAGMALFVPIVGTECSTAEPPPYGGRTGAELRACAAADVDRYTGIVVRVDGQEVPDIQTYRVSSPLFTLVLPDANVLGASAGPAHAVADGYQIMLAPLPVGDHEIMVHLELMDGTVLPDKIARITVVAPPVASPVATPDFGTPVATPIT
ncbi:MAG: hypothetical protein M3440_04310 [Chloroflexota bacterium]|nr:hypothetical protein [Chloroflexota bacterium]